jgi:hypothetical protein
MADPAAAAALPFPMADLVAALRAIVAVPPVPVVPTFGTNPADSHGTDPTLPWDFSSPAGARLFYTGTVPIPDTEVSTEAGLRIFLQKLRIRADTFGWSSLLMIDDSSAVSRNLLTHYGLLSLANVRDKALTYIGTETRDVQVSAQLVRVILTSVENRVLLELLMRSAEYTVNGVEDGPCMLKALISTVSVETRATVSYIRQQLAAMAVLMVKCASNIIDFNLEVTSFLDQLKARGEIHTGLLDGVFAAYKTSTNAEFVKYIKDKETNWQDGTIDDMTGEQLMILGKQKYIALQKFKSESKEMSAQDLEIVALKSSMMVLQAELKGKTTGGSKSKSRPHNNDFAWKDIAPTGNQPTTKIFRSREYIYCPNHEKTRWVLKVGFDGRIHSETCGQRAAATTPPVQERTASSKKKQQQLQYARALMTIIAGEDEGSDYEIDEQL